MEIWARQRWTNRVENRGDIIDIDGYNWRIWVSLASQEFLSIWRITAKISEYGLYSN